MGAMRNPTRPAAALLTGLMVAGCIPVSPRGSSPPVSPAEATATSTVEPSASGPSTQPSFVRPTPTPLPTFLVYTVRPGDTLSSIAREFRTTSLSIAFWNRTTHPSLDPDSPTYAPDRIQAGWDLLLVPDVELDPEDLPPEPSPIASPSLAAPSSPAASAS
jgi:LysM domain